VMYFLRCKIRDRSTNWHFCSKFRFSWNSSAKLQIRHDHPLIIRVWVNFDILEAWYGQTDGDDEFLRNQNERSILNLAIPFATLVSLTSTTWLTAVKHESPGFFQLNKILGFLLEEIKILWNSRKVSEF
jgi:hypothetical protein